MTSSPVDIVKNIYGLFAAGDIPGILATLAPDVRWEYGPLSHDVPWYRNRERVDGATRFFESLQGIGFQKFARTTWTRTRRG